MNRTFRIFASCKKPIHPKQQQKQPPMSETKVSAAAFADTKPHYNILGGLRGVAALIVVAFHLFETYSGGQAFQILNHGYLAVDFFFILSGFVIGYAYDDRWKRMTVREFVTRRFIRLHPMVVIGAVIGLSCSTFRAAPYGTSRKSR